jgi:CarD family transcriptional regulator
MFKKGELAVYPAHGVGVIEAIETKEISGGHQVFYIMRILENDMIIMIPQNSVQTVGLRHIVSKKEIPKIYEVLKNHNFVSNNGQSWHKRYREYADRLKIGSVCGLAELLKELTLIKKEKELSFAERRLLDTARRLLTKELSIAQDVPEKAIEKELTCLLDTTFR